MPSRWSCRKTLQTEETNPLPNGAVDRLRKGEAFRDRDTGSKPWLWIFPACFQCSFCRHPRDSSTPVLYRLLRAEGPDVGPCAMLSMLSPNGLGGTSSGAVVGNTFKLEMMKVPRTTLGCGPLDPSYRFATRSNLPPPGDPPTVCRVCKVVTYRQCFQTLEVVRASVT